MSSTTLDNSLTAATHQVTQRLRVRIDSIDIMRGFVIVLMALDHVRDYFSEAHLALLDPDKTTLGLYLTRWITHLCAPTFVFLAGISARRMAHRLSTRELSGFLLKRGVWLVLLEITVVLWGWSFSLSYARGFFLQVIWAIGASMIVLSALVYLPARAVGWIGAAIIVGHNLLDSVPASAFGSFAPLWSLLHVRGPMAVGFVSYPALPWMGVMALGFAAGALYDQDEEDRRWLLRVTGIAAIAAFFLLRAAAVYGDPHPWTPQPAMSATVMTLFDVQKYPPSLLYLLITLGIAAILLSFAESVTGVAARVLKLVDPKGKRARPVEHLLPVSAAVAGELDILLKANTEGPYIFSTTLGKKPIHHTTLGSTIAAIATATCPAGTRYRPGDVRRTVETRLQALGVSRDERAQLLSHGRTSGVQGKHYERYDYLDEKRAALALWENELARVLKVRRLSKSRPVDSSPRRRVARTPASKQASASLPAPGNTARVPVHA